MSKYVGGVAITGYISPTDTSDTFATHDSTLGRGGLREVQNLEERDLITEDRRKIGMIVYVVDEEKYYALFGDTTNLSWKDCGSQLGGYDELLAEIEALQEDVLALDLELDGVDDRLDKLEAVHPVYEISLSCTGTLAQGELLYIAPLPYNLLTSPEENCIATCLTPADSTLTINVDDVPIGTVVFIPDSLTGTVVITGETSLNKNSIMTIIAPQAVTELADVGVHLTFTIRENI